MCGQIVDATIMASPKQRNTCAEKADIKAGKVRDAWKEKPAQLRQKDRDARWTVKVSKAAACVGGVALHACSCGLYDCFQRIAITVNRPPQPALFSFNGDDHFFEMPFVGEISTGSIANAPCKLPAEFCGPFRYGLERNGDAAFGQKFLDVAQAKRKPIIRQIASAMISAG
jgi:hypothetical protein